ncbi:MAG TPA: hypothetical protein VNN79_07285 [Actinomycetota bacterium]|nr:hypothetical protein [Actinomycetota bacterium]
MSSKGWHDLEHVLAGPFRDLLRKACDEERLVSNNAIPVLSHFDHAKNGYQVVTSGELWADRYAERFNVSLRTAQRHFSLVLNQPSIPVVLADRVSALLGVPMAYLEAVS